MKRVVHVVLSLGDGEMAACGLAWDAYASGDYEHDDSFVDAHPGLRVTCPECCAAIRKMREDFRGLRLVAREGEG